MARKGNLLFSVKQPTSRALSYSCYVQDPTKEILRKTTELAADLKGVKRVLAQKFSQEVVS